MKRQTVTLTRGSGRWLAELNPHVQAIGWGPTASAALRDLADSIDANAEHYAALGDDDVTPEGEAKRKLFRELGTLAEPR